MIDTNYCCKAKSCNRCFTKYINMTRRVCQRVNDIYADIVVQ